MGAAFPVLSAPSMAPHCIAGNDIGADGCQAFGQALKTNATLTAVELGCMPCPAACASACVRGLRAQAVAVQRPSRSTHTQGCITGAGNSEAAPEAVRQAVGGGCQSGWGRLLSVTNAVEVGTWRQGDSGWG